MVYAPESEYVKKACHKEIYLFIFSLGLNLRNCESASEQIWFGKPQFELVVTKITLIWHYCKSTLQCY